mmetsp:Transcript_91120/g.162189  ORF Transcript_91120/g.162189 Transcript_91120/m.162189 type:complete len:201 (+) Transcript_91120:891-1493(+)
MAKFELFTRHFRSFRPSCLWRCSDFDSAVQPSEVSLMSPTFSRCIQAFLSFAAFPFCLPLLLISAASSGFTAGFSTSRLPLRLTPKPSTAGSSRWSLRFTTEPSSFSFCSASASVANAACAPEASANLMKAEPRWLFWPVLSGTSLMEPTFPNWRKTSRSSGSPASKGTLRTNTVRPWSISKPGFLSSFSFVLACSLSFP